MLATLAWISLIAAFASALVIAVDEARHPQKMWIMNLVWPITALYFSFFAVWAYFRLGRRPHHEALSDMAHASVQRTAEHPDPNVATDRSRDQPLRSWVHGGRYRR